ncbi:hypothetical protein CRENBAI_001989 [Crenichthys baileyi]|uniref:Uncharacterized protein n=1 Tax=Crenichthys baileyi TaxID=28760 RepID=A0AAV9QWK4_9TELE
MEREVVQRPSAPSSLVARPNKAVKPTSSCRCKKRRRGTPSCVSAGEEESPTAAAVTSGAVVSLPTDVRAAASNPTTSSATALSPRLTAAPPMLSLLAPAQCFEATPDELEQRLRVLLLQSRPHQVSRVLLQQSNPGLVSRVLLLQLLLSSPRQVYSLLQSFQRGPRTDRLYYLFQVLVARLNFVPARDDLLWRFLEVLPSPLLLEQMEREVVQRPSAPSSLVARPNKAVKPTSSCRCKKRRRGTPSCVSAGEEESPTAAAVTSGAVVSLPTDVRAAASNPTTSSATALSPRLTAAPPMLSLLAPAQCFEATPDELEQRLRFYARQIKSFRRTCLLYSSPELRERIRQMEEE